jgi:hypothetical protein
MDSSVSINICDSRIDELDANRASRQDILLYAFTGDVHITGGDGTSLTISDIPIVHFLNAVWSAVPIVLFTDKRARIEHVFRSASTVIEAQGLGLRIRHEDPHPGMTGGTTTFDSVRQFTSGIGEAAENLYRSLAARFPNLDLQVLPLTTFAAIEKSRADKEFRIF